MAGDDYIEGGTAQDEEWEGEGCRPASGNDANVACGATRNSRPDTRNTQGAKRGKMPLIPLA